MDRDNPIKNMGVVTAAIPGIRHDTLSFHASMLNVGLYPTYEAPHEFMKWVEDTIEEWPFECICSARNCVLRSGGNTRLRELLADSKQALSSRAVENALSAFKSGLTKIEYCGNEHECG